MTKRHQYVLWLDFNASGVECSGLDKQLNQLQTISIVAQQCCLETPHALPYKRDTAGIPAILEHPDLSKQLLSRQVTLACVPEPAACSFLALQLLQV